MIVADLDCLFLEEERRASAAFIPKSYLGISFEHVRIVK